MSYATETEWITVTLCHEAKPRLYIPVRAITAIGTPVVPPGHGTTFIQVFGGDCFYVMDEAGDIFKQMSHGGSRACDLSTPVEEHDGKPR